MLVERGSGQIAGYYTLSNLSIVPADLPEELKRKLPRYVSLPAILIGRLAMDQRYAGQGLGELLLTDALHRSFEASQHVAAMAVVVDAKDEAARRFHERYGFKRFVDHEYRLFLPMATIAQLPLPRIL